jgi:beta-mannosidase
LLIYFCLDRVWGGGIYEDDAFYDICDELGILVWQDFMFGCGNYPCYPEMLASVKQEAIANVRRLRHHACMAIFAGNNEDYQVAEAENLHYDYDDKDEDNWLKSDFPARYIYESLLPKVMAAEAPSIPYHPGSPWGDGKRSSDPTVGDIHQWNVVGGHL